MRFLYPIQPAREQHTQAHDSCRERPCHLAAQLDGGAAPASDSASRGRSRSRRGEARGSTQQSRLRIPSYFMRGASNIAVRLVRRSISHTVVSTFLQEANRSFFAGHLRDQLCSVVLSAHNAGVEGSIPSLSTNFILPAYSRNCLPGAAAS